MPGIPNCRRRSAAPRTSLRTVLLIVIWILGVSLMGQSLDLREAVSRVLQEDPTVLVSGEGVGIAYSAFNRAKADSLPQVSLSTDYSLTYQSFIDMSSANYGNHSVSTGLSFSQILPTSGNISVILSDAMDVTSKDKDLTFSQSPFLSVTLEQPVFYNGKIFDTSLLPASIRKERIGYLKAEEQNRTSQNAAISSALNLYFQVVLLRKQILLAQNILALQEENQRKAERNFELGLVSETDVWETRLEVGKQKELLLDSRFSLLQTEAALKQSLGSGDHTRGAVATLDGLFFDEGFLQGMQILGRSQSLNSDDLRANHIFNGQFAGGHRLPVNQGFAGPALLRAAAVFDAFQPQVIT